MRSTRGGPDGEEEAEAQAEAAAQAAGLLTMIMLRVLSTLFALIACVGLLAGDVGRATFLLLLAILFGVYHRHKGG